MDTKSALLIRVVGSLIKTVAALGQWAIELSLRIEGTPPPKTIQAVQSGMHELVEDGMLLVGQIAGEPDAPAEAPTDKPAKKTTKKASKKAAAKGGS